MRTTFSALKVWLTVGIIITAFGCAKKGDDNGGGNGYGYCPGCYGGTGYSTGSGTPGQPLTSTPVTASYRDSSGTLIVDMELDLISTGAAGAAQVRGVVRLSNHDYLCNVMWNPGQQMPINEQASSVQIVGASIQRVKGTISFPTATGAQLQVVLDDGTNSGLLLRTRTGAIPGPITGRPSSYSLEGRTMVQSGSCSNNPNLGWPLQ